VVAEGVPPSSGFFASSGTSCVSGTLSSFVAPLDLGGEWLGGLQAVLRGVDGGVDSHWCGSLVEVSRVVGLVQAPEGVVTKGFSCDKRCIICGAIEGAAELFSLEY
jgi:hypothetical protein